MDNSRNQNYQWLKALATDLGASLFGVADIEPMKKRFFLHSDELDGLKYGVALGVQLSASVLAGIEDGPTLLYKWHYRQANNLLDRMAFQITGRLVDKRFKALPIPASQMIDWQRQIGHVSHRMVAEAAGLGWRGKNNLLINEKYGAMIRLITILTDIPLTTDEPVENQCGSCKACVKACPAGALGDSPADYQLDKCAELLKEFSKRPGIGQKICGICIKNCPKGWG